MDVDCYMGVDCSATYVSDYNDSDIEAMDDDKRERTRRQVTLSQKNRRVRSDETANSYHGIMPAPRCTTISLPPDSLLTQITGATSQSAPMYSLENLQPH